MNSRLSPTILPQASYLTAAATGGDSFWVGDHLNALLPQSIATPEHFGIAAKLVPNVDAVLEPWTMLGNLAARNRLRRLRLGVCVTDGSRRNPAITAQAAATLHLLTRGRAILGIGVGEREGTEPYGVEWTKPVARFEEAIATIRTLWDSAGELITRDSPYFPLRNATFALPPYRGKWPEIWVAAHGPRMLRITGRYADAWVPFVISRPADYAGALEAVRAAASDAGRDADDDRSRAQSRRRHRAQSRRRGRSAGICRDQSVGARGTRRRAGRASALNTPWEPTSLGRRSFMPQTIDQQTALSYTAKVPASLMKELTFNGTPDEVIDQVAQWRDQGLRYLLIINASPLNPRLRKSLAANAPFIKILRSLKKL